MSNIPFSSSFVSMQKIMCVAFKVSWITVRFCGRHCVLSSYHNLKCVTTTRYFLRCTSYIRQYSCFLLLYSIVYGHNVRILAQQNCYHIPFGFTEKVSRKKNFFLKSVGQALEDYKIDFHNTHRFTRTKWQQLDVKCQRRDIIRQQHRICSNKWWQ